MISFKNFSFKYNNVVDKTLKNIDLTINKGEKVLIVGPSGSGKSTLSHCINGLIPFSYNGEIEGELIIDNIKPYEESLSDVSNEYDLGYEYVYGPDIERDFYNPLYEDVLLDSLYRLNRDLPDDAIQDALFKLKNFENGETYEKKIQI